MWVRSCHLILILSLDWRLFFVFASFALRCGVSRCHALVPDTRARTLFYHTHTGCCVVNHRFSLLVPHRSYTLSPLTLHMGCRYRTSDGYLGVGTSIDGGASFRAPQYAEYERSTPGERNALKNPRGPITPRRFGDRYLLLYFNRGAGGIQGSRNPYWLAAGAYDKDRATIVWSQPEIVLYTT